MLLLGKFYLLASFSLFSASVAYATDQPDLGGFMLGGSFEAAQQHALEQEWKLVQHSENLPGQWVVEEANLSLFVCNGIVTSIAEQLEGDLEEFAALILTMQLEFGKPDIQILSIPSGIGIISTIDARFDTNNGGATVQLQSIGGKRTFSESHWINTECN